MSTSSEIKQRANALAEKTDVNSITPKEVGSIMYDLASHSENVLRNGGTLGIRKVYESVAAMEADSTNPIDIWGNPIKKGNLVVIYDGTTTGVDNNKIYAFMNPGWQIATHLDAGYATKAETEKKLAELGREVGIVYYSDTHTWNGVDNLVVGVDKGKKYTILASSDSMFKIDVTIKMDDGSYNTLLSGFGPIFTDEFDVPDNCTGDVFLTSEDSTIDIKLISASNKAQIEILKSALNKELKRVDSDIDDLDKELNGYIVYNDTHTWPTEVENLIIPVKSGESYILSVKSGGDFKIDAVVRLISGTYITLYTLYGLEDTAVLDVPLDSNGVLYLTSVNATVSVVLKKNNIKDRLTDIENADVWSLKKEINGAAVFDDKHQWDGLTNLVVNVKPSEKYRVRIESDQAFESEISVKLNDGTFKTLLNHIGSNSINSVIEIPVDCNGKLFISGNNLYADVLIEEWSIKLRVGSLENEIGSLNAAIEVNDNTSFIEYKQGSIDDWVYTSEGETAYYGSEKQFEKDTIVGRVYVRLFSNNHDYNGEYAQVVVGSIDQRGWLFPRFTFTGKLEKWEKNEYAITCNGLVAKEGEVLFVGVKSFDVALFPLSNNGGIKAVYTKNLLDPLTYSDKSIVYFGVEVNEIESAFAYKTDVESLNDRVSGVEQLANNNVLVDRVTSERYILTVSNGILGVKKVSYHKILVLGNSFTMHGSNEGVWWSDEYSRCMASSSVNTMYTSLMEESAGYEITRGSTYNWERAYVDFDYSKMSMVTNEYDAVIIQFGENVLTTGDEDEFRTAYNELLTYILSVCTNADVYTVIGHKTGWVAKVIKEVSASLNIPNVDCTGVSLVGHYNLGDYVLGDNGEYHHIENKGVSNGHPSDIGEYNIANSLLGLLGSGVRIEGRLFDIELIQSIGGSISVSTGNKGVSNGVISVKCVGNVGYSIDNVTALDESGNNIPTVLRVNEYGTYYTFIMPASRVRVIPTWKVV